VRRVPRFAWLLVAFAGLRFVTEWRRTNHETHSAWSATGETLLL